MQKGRHCFGAVLVFLILWVVILVVFFSSLLLVRITCSESFLSVISISPSSLKNKNSLRNAVSGVFERKSLCRTNREAARAGVICTM